MLKTTNKAYLTKLQYNNEKNLLIRKNFNKLSVPLVNFVENIFNEIVNSKAKKVLDIGCGNGDLLIELRRKGFDKELTGVELSKGMLKNGIKTNNNESLGINFVVGDAQKLPFDDNYFDIIIAKHMLYHLEDINKGVSEFYRCLKPGGELIITLNSEKNKPKLMHFEEMMCKKFKLKTIHGQEIVSTESIVNYLKNFKEINVTIKKGIIKLKDPEDFVKYFSTFRTNYEPIPSDENWFKVIEQVRSEINEEINKNGFFEETNIVGMITAKKLD